MKRPATSATRITASVVGGYAGLLGAVHGCFEILQGDVVPGGIGIEAIGPPCQADVVWHACLPAMTVVPHMRATGVLAVLISLMALLWAVVASERRRGGLVLILLSILVLLFGGGFVSTFTGIIAGVAGTRIGAPPAIFRARYFRLLAGLWPWSVVAFVAWSGGGWILGKFFNQAMIDLGFILFFCCNLGLPLLAVLTGFVRDARSGERAGLAQRGSGSRLSAQAVQLTTEEDA